LPLRIVAGRGGGRGRSRRRRRRRRGGPSDRAPAARRSRCRCRAGSRRVEIDRDREVEVAIAVEVAVHEIHGQRARRDVRLRPQQAVPLAQQDRDHVGLGGRRRHVAQRAPGPVTPRPR
jgi:hypothetical protein